AVYDSLFEHVVAPLARAYAPQLILLSAGFDGHRDDPLADVELTEDGFAALAGTVRRLAAELEAPVGAVLEGGYDLRALAASTAATLRVLTAADPPPAGDVPMTPQARAAAARLAERWPAPAVRRFARGTGVVGTVAGAVGVVAGAVWSGVVAVGVVAGAVTVVAGAGVELGLPTSATSPTAIAAAASASTTHVSSTGRRQLGGGWIRVRVASPHSRHQLWSACSVELQRGHSSAPG